MQELSLEVTRVIAAPQEAVYEAWLDPEKLRRFMTPGPGMRVASAETDPREGGRFAIVMANDEAELLHEGTYEELRPHDRIVFTWESPFSAEGSRVTLDFAPADGGTEVRLRHVRFPDLQSRDNHEGGWSTILSVFAAVLEDDGRDG